MTYSKTHKCFADRLNNQRALECPEDYLGSNWKDVLNFWWYLEGLSGEQRKIVRQRYAALDPKIRDDAWKAARYAARDAAGAAAYYAAAAAWDAADVAWGAAWGAAAAAVVATGYATWELIGSHSFLEQGKSLTFLPLFLDL
jgi:hypothetical protein